jgi:hypothetical protein
MPLATRHRDDLVPSLGTLDGLVVRREESAAAMAALQGRSEAVMASRFEDGNRAYVATMNGQPAAWGWVATQSADIGELATSFGIAAGERYLWNFSTLKSHRGLGIYPRLLDAIVRAESSEASRFWVAYAPENHASGSGIFKAGFVAVAELSFDAMGNPAIAELRAGGGTIASRVLGLPVATEALAPCWRCVRAGKPEAMACREGTCRCDYQRMEMSCAM